MKATAAAKVREAQNAYETSADESDYAVLQLAKQDYRDLKDAE